MGADGPELISGDRVAFVGVEVLELLGEGIVVGGHSFLEAGQQLCNGCFSGRRGWRDSGHPLGPLIGSLHKTEWESWPSVRGTDLSAQGPHIWVLLGRQRGREARCKSITDASLNRLPSQARLSGVEVTVGPRGGCVTLSLRPGLAFGAFSKHTVLLRAARSLQSCAFGLPGLCFHCRV